MVFDAKGCMVKVIGDISLRDGRRGAHAWFTLGDMRRDLQATADRFAQTVTVDAYRDARHLDAPGDPFGLDVPTWRIIRRPQDRIGLEVFIPSQRRNV